MRKGSSVLTVQKFKVYEEKEKRKVERSWYKGKSTGGKRDEMSPVE
jgi:hypothetical protein